MASYGPDGIEKGMTGGERTAMVYAPDGSVKTSASSGGAPIGSPYVTTSADATLTNEFVATDTASIDVVIAGSTVTWERAALTGDVTASQNSNATTIANNAVTDVKLRDSSGFSVIGKATTGSGDPADIVAADETVLGRTGGGNVAFAQVATGQIANDAVTDTKIRNSTALSVIGRSVNSSGDPADISTTSGSRKFLGENGSGVLEFLTLAGGTGGRIAHYDNPPASTHAYSDEFDSTTLDVKWTVTAGPTATAVDPAATLASAQRYDLSTWPSWLLFQGHNAGTTQYNWTQSITLDTNATIFARLSSQVRGATGGAANVAADESTIGILLGNSGDGNEFVGFQIRQNGAGPAGRALVVNNGAQTNIDGSGAASGYCIIYKEGSVYRFYTTDINAGMQYWGTLTKTGVTTFDQLIIQFNTCNDTVTPILGIDFVRYYASNTYALRNF